MLYRISGVDMIKRNDLIKQFELTTKQEIKNHNDAIAAHNSAVDEIRRIAESNSRDIVLSESRLESRMSQLESSINQIEVRIEIEVTKTLSRLNDMCRLISNVLSTVDSMKNNMIIVHGELERLDTVLSEVCHENSCSMKELQHSVYDARQEAKLNHRKICCDFDKKLKERDERPCKVKALKEELTDKIEIKEVHTRGVLEEIRALRREFLYEKSKIENLYTLIGRLQKKV